MANDIDGRLPLKDVSAILIREILRIFPSAAELNITPTTYMQVVSFSVNRCLESRQHDNDGTDHHEGTLANSILTAIHSALMLNGVHADPIKLLEPKIEKIIVDSIGRNGNL